MRDISWIVIFFVTLLLGNPLAFAAEEDPDCTGTERWPAMMTMTHLQNAGKIDHKKQELDYSKTKINRIASEKTGDDLYRQVYYMTFTKKSGDTIEVITVSDASHEECSMGDVSVFVIAEQLIEKSRILLPKVTLPGTLER